MPYRSDRRDSKRSRQFQLLMNQKFRDEPGQYRSFAEQKIGGMKYMSGYIMDLRKIVGHRPLMQCAASVIVVDEQGRLLLGRRTDNHLWGYSGGSIELDEHAEDCARRELNEEMGLFADELEFFMVNSGPEAHYIYPNGDEVSNVELVYICRKYHGIPVRQEEEIEELRFFDPDSITMDIISPPIRPVLARYLKCFSE